MLFSTYSFIFIFLPIVIIAFDIINRKSYLKKYIVGWLIIASFVFYGWNDYIIIFILIFSIILNYLVSGFIGHKKNGSFFLILGISINILILILFKYSDFIIENINQIFNADILTLNLLLPIGISFFTFQQISYLIDRKVHNLEQFSFSKYILFISYFPKLISGPIVRYSDLNIQLESKIRERINIQNLANGLFIFFQGLFKKVVLADTLAVWATYGFDKALTLGFIEAWATSFCFTFQIYFDFSGYTDMAIGISKIFNIELPNNFNSPYKSLNIRDFWNRWHITFSAFLRDYIYIPMGGSRISTLRTYFNIIITFFICGLWHGAGWNFIIWGILHGTANIIHRTWKNTKIHFPYALSWLMTILFINFAWIFFRAKNISSAMKVIKGMINVQDMTMINPIIILLLLFSLIIALFFQNSYDQLKKRTVFTWKYSLYLSILAFVSIMAMSIRSSHDFLYFKF